MQRCLAFLVGNQPPILSSYRSPLIVWRERSCLATTLARINVRAAQRPSVCIRLHTSCADETTETWLRERDSFYQLALLHLHTSAYVSVRQHTSAYVSRRQHTSVYARHHWERESFYQLALLRLHTSAYVSVRQHTSAYVCIRETWLRERASTLYRSSACIRPYTSAYVSIRQYIRETFLRERESRSVLYRSSSTSSSNCNFKLWKCSTKIMTSNVVLIKLK
jgi:hypothetical protein